jgi:hypothetical protein
LLLFIKEKKIMKIKLIFTEAQMKKWVDEIEPSLAPAEAAELKRTTSLFDPVAESSRIFFAFTPALVRGTRNKIFCCGISSLKNEMPPPVSPTSGDKC